MKSKEWNDLSQWLVRNFVHPQPVTPDEMLYFSLTCTTSPLFFISTKSYSLS